MRKKTKERIKEKIEFSIRNYFKDRKVKSYQVLDEIFPKERRVRSLIGGLETSLGTTLWEPLAKELAKSNGFEVLDEKSFPAPKDESFYPKDILNIKLKWEQKRQIKNKYISLNDYIEELRDISKLNKKKYQSIEKGPMTSGRGVDVYLKKDGKEYAFDIKTVQINKGGGNNYNQTLMWWYAARILYQHNIKFKAAIVFPYNPYKTKTWWQANGGRAYPLKEKKDAFVEDEFWDFISGQKGTFQQIKLLFQELGKSNFANQFKDIFYPS